jgi:hypothetical protein
MYSFSFFEVMDGSDVGMIQRSEQAGFALESRQPLFVFREGFGKNLDGNIAT